MNPIDLLVETIREHSPENIWLDSPLIGYRMLGNTNRGEIGPETMPAGSGTICITAADLPDLVEQRRGADDGSAHRREEHFRFQALKAAVQEYLDSGVSDRTIPAIMEEVEARLRGEGRL